MTIIFATEKDSASLASLINSAYRGESSKSGWTTEADIIGGQHRILQPELEQLMKRPGVIFLKAEDQQNRIAGCVFLEKRGDQLYLGMLSVDPQLQANGTGKQLVAAAEDHARRQQCSSVIMRVINLRKELIAWYERRGYYNTDLTESYQPEPYETILMPFHFVVLQKDL